MALNVAQFEQIENYTKRVETGLRMDEDDWQGNPNQVQIQDLNQKLAVKEIELKEMEESIRHLQMRKEKIMQEAEELRRSLRVLRAPITNKGKSKAQQTINYAEDEFDWSNALQSRMKKMFNIDNFRHCQRGVCNANMDRRDIVCVMPTGGGKSLTYQLPALLTTGCTIVISPLLALITDQVLHLQELGIAAAMLTGETPSAEKKDVVQRLRNLANPQNKGEDLKFVYVTPEKLVKDNSFKGLLTKLAAAGRLARFVIDEAHCVSQLGHDFRPDYKELHILRKLYPHVPIMALSATCPPLVLQDLLKILCLKPITHGNDANMDGTVYFSSPLYRKNLHYKVVPKPATSAATYQAIVDYILAEHPNETGIIYCFSQKDTENCAEKVQELSNGRIRTGYYHARLDAPAKIKLHSDWRVGRVKVVCATIAFGLGIDKGDVRFVIHHSIPKSVDGYYQESGRAGRDGKDSDCVLYYRPQDSVAVGSLVGSAANGIQKLHEIIDFVDNLVECRKIQFANYFRHSVQMSISSWSTAEKDALDRCGHCDNCLRDPASIEKRDVTLVSWQILKIVQEMKKLGKKMTLSQLATLARGKGKSQVEVNTGRGRRKAKEVMDVDLDSVCGGPAQDISANDIERVIVRLLLDGYLEEEFKATSYSINVYLTLGQLKGALVHTRREDIERGASRTKIEMTFVKPETKTRKSKTKATNATGEAKKGSPLKTKTTAQGSNTNGGGKLRQTQLQMRVEEESEQEYIDIYEGLDEDEESDEAYGEDEEEPAPPTRAAQSRKRSHGRGAVEPEVIEVLDSDEIVSPSESEEDDEWLFNQRGKPKPPPKKIRKVESGSSGMQNGRSKVGSGGRGGRRTILSDVDEDEIMVVSSD